MKYAFFRSQSFRRLFYFFPLQLFLAHLKKNHVLLFFWLLVLGLITGSLGTKYGISYLFLSPEYIDDVSFVSYLVYGFAFGGFVMAFNISSYIMNGHRFPFIATLSRPFFKYCVNNSLIPLIAIVMYIYNVIDYHEKNTFATGGDLFFYIIGFLVGYTAFVMLSIGYFYQTNKDIKKLFGIETEIPVDAEKKEEFIKKKKTIKTVLHKKYRWYDFLSKDREWTIETYLANPFKLRLARNIEHYDNSMLRGVLKQNHLNAALFEIIAFVTIIALSFLSEIRIFMIPAGASLLLMFTMFIMIFSALHSWFKGWSTTVFILIFAGLNWMSQYDLFDSSNKAYGLNYNTTKSDFSHESINHFVNKDIYQHDFKHGIEILNNWRMKNNKRSVEQKKKPKLVMINTSGGGIRSMLWSYTVLSHVDSLLDGELMDYTVLMTGSSGGLIGASYMRELYYQEQIGDVNDRHSPRYRENVSKDVLNPVAFNWAVNDLFKFRSFNVGKYVYPKDRGYAFEKKLNENLGGVFDKKLEDYYDLERSAMIPMVVITPTIEDDYRQLLICSQPISYLSRSTHQENMTNVPVIDGIEFTRFFREQDAYNLLFSSALRMNATFPYIMPSVSLPSSPELNAVDAGLRDNFGLKTSLKYLYTFRNWISTNTSGVIIINVRDKQKNVEITDMGGNTFMETVKSPVTNSIKNLFNVQNYNLDLMLQMTSAWYDGQVDVVDLCMHHTGTEKISLSWHLTPREKSQIFEAIYQNQNQEEIERLINLMQ